MRGPKATSGQKRAAAELLYGEQDWDLIRARARRDTLNGALEPEEEARIRGVRVSGVQLPAPD